LRESLTGLRPRSGTIPFFSTVTGKRLPGESLNADYWWKNVREPVRFCSALTSLGEAGFGIVLEIGPHSALLPSIRETLEQNSGSCSVTGSLYRREPPSLSLSRALASLWVSGIDPDWESFLGQRAVTPDGLPRYPWQHKHFWLESPESERLRTGRSDHPLLGPRLIEPHPAWETLLDPRAYPWVNDHKISNRLIFPAAGFAGVILGAGEAAFPNERITLERLAFERILFIPSEVPPTLRVEMDPDRQFVSIYSRSAEAREWTRHARGRIFVEPGPPPDPPVRAIGQLRQRLTSHFAHWDFYEGFGKEGYNYGPSFRGIEQVWYKDNEALSEVIQRDEVREDARSWQFHPALLDASFQTLRAATEFKREEESAGQYWLPFSLAEWVHFSEITDRFYVHAQFTRREGDRVTADLECLAPDGTVICQIRGFVLAKMTPQAGLSQGDEGICELRWSVQELPREEKDAPPLPKQAILIGNRGDFVDQLASALEAREVHVERIAATLSTEARREQLLKVLAEIPDDNSSRDLAILHLCPLDDPEACDLNARSLEKAIECGVYGLLDIAQALQHTGRKARIHSLVRASSSAGAPGHCRPASASLTGFTRVASSELPDSEWSIIQLESHESSEDLDRVLRELQAKEFESEVSWFAGIRHVARLSPIILDDLPRRTRPAIDEKGESRAHALINARPGTLERIELIEVPRPDPGPGEVEVRVLAAGVNFRDLLKALNRYPGTPEDLAEMGDDFAGEVLRIGSEVTHLSPGDRVMGVARGTFRSHLLVEARRLIPVPSGMLLTEAATLPTTFLTAHHALRDIARLRSGESILIHAAAGGVGLAAIQVAKNIGLEIFATAGSPEKRGYLSRLGVGHVMDSRSLSFAREIREITGGRGIDAVLNSLAGEFLLKSLESLAPFGRFLEIGKLDLYADRSVGLSALRNAVSISVIDMDRFLNHRAEEATRLYTEVAFHVHENQYQPLAHQVFPATEAGEVFREMARGQHLGKRVLDFHSADVSIGVPDGTGMRFPSDATFLVAGGHSGFGFETARWLVDNGVRHLALLSRNGPRDESILTSIEEMTSRGVAVHDLRADLTDDFALTTALAKLREQAPPLAGVFHTAMVLDDRFISDQDRNSFAAALDPKIRGSWFLHQATLRDPLHWFVVYSSFSATAGSPRQANYAAGNSFLEGLMRERRSEGLPGLAVAWGPISGAGFVERSEKTRAFLERTGCKTISAHEALVILGRVLDRDVAALTVSKTDWGVLARFAPALARMPMFQDLPGINENHLAHRLSLEQLQSVPKDQQRILIEEFLVTQFSAVFGTARTEVERTTPVTHMGLDSLMAIELLNRIEAGMGIPFPMGTILSGPSVRELAEKITQSIPEAETVETAKVDE
ncbi:MAG: SDR family NAD(P)-dependent oxidoreductase, partial [Verrucomicrobiae bacterium]|nr:SDR family NAD(P)-dependent oxidoreductase [Verrucomicrobiae bacterium]